MITTLHFFCLTRRFNHNAGPEKEVSTTISIPSYRVTIKAIRKNSFLLKEQLNKKIIEGYPLISCRYEQGTHLFRQSNRSVKNPCPQTYRHIGRESPKRSFFKYRPSSPILATTLSSEKKNELHPFLSRRTSHRLSGSRCLQKRKTSNIHFSQAEAEPLAFASSFFFASRRACIA